MKETEGRYDMDYKAFVMAVSFDNKYNYEGVIFLGDAKSPLEAHGLVQKDILRLLEDYEGSEVQLEEIHDTFGEDVIIAHYKYDKNQDYHHMHYYCTVEKKEDVGVKIKI